MSTTTCRWIGTVGMVNRPNTDLQTLAVGDLDELRRFLKWKLMHPPASSALHEMCHQPLPLPLLGKVADVWDVVGEVDTLAPMANGRILGSGTIDLDSTEPWCTNLLAGGAEPVSLAIDHGETIHLDIHRRPLRTFFRRVTETHHIATGWRIRNLHLGMQAGWPIKTEIRLSQPRPPDTPTS